MFSSEGCGGVLRGRAASLLGAFGCSFCVSRGDARTHTHTHARARGEGMCCCSYVVVSCPCCLFNHVEVGFVACFFLDGWGCVGVGLACFPRVILPCCRRFGGLFLGHARSKGQRFSSFPRQWAARAQEGRVFTVPFLFSRLFWFS